jgi:hypothetical protein
MPWGLTGRGAHSTPHRTYKMSFSADDPINKQGDGDEKSDLFKEVGLNIPVATWKTKTLKQNNMTNPLKW